MADSSSNTIRLFMFGRTGNGKSSIGNSILNEKKFTPRSTSSTSSSKDISVETTTEGTPITVVDGPSIRDASTDVTEDGQSLIDLVLDALSKTSGKFDALIIPLKYGVRYTNQEREAIQIIKAILGEDVIKNYGIIVMTHGDNFDGDVEDEGTTFETWCDEQSGDIRDLFHECDKRRVLFDNRSKINDKKTEQKNQLLKLIDDIKKQRQPYSEEDFKKAEPGQKKLNVLRKLPDLNSKTETVLSDITKTLDQLRKQTPTVIIDQIQKISKDLQEHKKWLQKEDDNTGSIDHLLLRISITETNIRTMTETNKHKIEYSRELEQQETVGKKKIDNPSTILHETARKKDNPSTILLETARKKDNPSADKPKKEEGKDFDKWRSWILILGIIGSATAIGAYIVIKKYT